MRTSLRHFRLALLVWIGYSAYRVLQTALFASLTAGGVLAASHRVLYSLLDGGVLALATLVPVAAAEHFPVERRLRTRNLLVNASLTVALTVAFTVVALL